MRLLRLPLAIALFSACSSSLDPAVGPADGGPTDAAPPCTAIADCAWPAPMAWQEPIADYVAEASKTLDPKKLNKAIDDLIVFDDRLFLGYGDATLNAGRVVPIQIRSWASPADPSPTADAVVTAEEEISLFRRFGDVLMVPGVDAREDAFLGNAFTRPKGGSFTKHRAIKGGVHVHDIAAFGGELWACGSGALDLDTWNAGKIHSFLWRSADGGATWSTAAEIENSEIGDRRWVQMVPFSKQLLLYGYRTNAKGQIAAVLADAWDGAKVVPSDATSKSFVLGAELLDPKTALLRTVDVGATPLRHRALLLKEGSAAVPIAALDGKTVLDASAAADGKMVLVVTDGDTYPLPSTVAPWRVLYTEDGVEVRELTAGESTAWPTAIAHWKRGLYVGLANGQVLRSAAP
ncbi:MAG: hypothetical protein HYV09_35975 [Deltaproteobacteria bacterium]|nr:hypothetical protein [Deltaproteobacteria bacterium]